MNYKIIGHDGKIYGPIQFDQLKVWLEQARVDQRTAVWVEGAADWTFLGLLPEFAAAFGTPPPPISSTRPVAVLAPKTNPFATWSLICGLLLLLRTFQSRRYCFRHYCARATFRGRYHRGRPQPGGSRSDFIRHQPPLVPRLDYL
jgi:hypothetical protein